LALQKRFDFDFVKVTPSGLCPVADWAVRVGPPYTTHGEPHHSAYGRDSDRGLGQVRRAPDPTVGRLAQEVGAAGGAISNGLGGSAPLVQTFFMPLSTAAKMCGDRCAPKRTCTTIRLPSTAPCASVTESTVAYIRACCTTGKADRRFPLHQARRGRRSARVRTTWNSAYPMTSEVLERIKDVCKLHHSAPARRRSLL